MDKSEVAVVELLEADEEFSEAVEPTVGDLDDPTPMLGWPTSPRLALLADACVVSPFADCIEGGLTGVPAVGE
jgi:hypothetical protein